MKKRKITLCSSGSFYKKVLGLKKQLEQMEFEVFVPHIAYKMEETGNFKIDDYKVWYQDPSLYHLKTERMDEHLKEIDKGDCILVVNLSKKGFDGYIGANVLLEMFYARLKNKPIYVLNSPDQDLSCYEEIMGMSPIIIDNNLTLIT